MSIAHRNAATSHAHPVIAHPTYCVADRCEATEDNVEHCSTPVTLVPTVNFDVPVRVALGRLDEVLCGEQFIGDDSVLLSLVGGVGGPSAETALSESDARALAVQLVAHADRLAAGGAA